VDCDKPDRYDRIIGKVMVAPADTCPGARDDCPKTLDTSLAQISVGLAWCYRKYSGQQCAEDRRQYESVETQAREEKAGLWADNELVLPCE
jgi:endonuclease YncB( thermonuclease family)